MIFLFDSVKLSALWNFTEQRWHLF